MLKPLNAMPLTRLVSAACLTGLTTLSACVALEATGSLPQFSDASGDTVADAAQPHAQPHVNAAKLQALSLHTEALPPPPVVHTVPALAYLPLVENHAVLEAHADPTLAVAGSARLTRVGEGWDAVVQDVDPARVPALYRGLIGQDLALYNDAKPACTTPVLRLQLLTLTSAEPEYTDYEDESDEIDVEAGETEVVEPTGGVPEGLGDDEAAEVESLLAREGAVTYLTAEMELPSGCLGGVTSDVLWARAAHLPAPDLAERTAARPRLVRSLQAAVRATSEWSKRQADYQNMHQTLHGDEAWDEHGGAHVVVDLWRGNGKALARVSVHGGGFGTTLTQWWRLDGDLDGQPRLQRLDGIGVYLTPAGAADLDGDGELELLLDQGQVEGRAVHVDPDLPARVFADGGC